ncbi:MAG: DUF2341 domain-containing protein, partial [Candidatus Thorarchaeota archaeon]
GTTVAHEIELFDQATGHLVAWVKVPSLSSSTDTTITMLYGCANVPAIDSGNVWEDFEVVQHLNNDPTGVQYDSTSNNHDGTSYGGLTSADSILGKIGPAVGFDGVNDVISLGQVYTDDWTEFTMSVWLYQNFTGDDRCFSKSLTTTPTNHIITTRVAGNYLTTRLRTDGTGGTGNSYDSITTVSLEAWHYVSWSWSSSRGSVIAYLDGDLVIEMTHNGDTIFDSDALLVIGNNDLTNDRFWNGSLDEARLTTMIRSEAWVDTEYSNQNNPSGFYSVGLQESTPSTWTDAGETHVVFTTSSPSPVSMGVIITMDVGGVAQSMDTDFNEGVSYFIESGSNIVNWTTKVMVSPPAGATAFGFSVDYPRAEWKATKVINPLGQPKTVGQDWWYRGGTLTLNASAIDFWGVWTLKFISWNFMENLVLSDTTFDIDDTAQFTMTTPTVNGARVGLDLVKPNGDTWYSSSALTSTNPDHKFPSFKYRKDITIPSSEILGTVTNFPVAINIDDAHLHNQTKARSDGSDILFAQGDTILDHEIEFFDQDYFIDEARLVAWVKMNLTLGFDSVVTMYYGAEIVDNLQNPEGVWSNGFEAVWHLDEAGAGSTHHDSTGNNHIGVGNDEFTPSILGNGLAFDGIGDYVAFDENLAPSDDVVISGWFYLPALHDDTSATTQVIMEKYIDNNHNMVIALVGQDYAQGTVANGSLVFKVESSPNGALYAWTTKTSWNPGWYYISCYADEDNPTNNQIWVNFNWDVSGRVGSPSQANMSYIEDWRLGGGDYDSGSVGSGYFDGSLDEFRVATTYRDASWLKNEYQNQLNPSSFLVPGSEQMRTSPEHVIPKDIDSSAPAGNWTAIAYYNDTGTTVTSKTGLIERTFIVRHPSLLSLQDPSDAIGGQRTTMKTVGDALIIEYELTDTITTLGVPGAEVTMNWSSPATINLDDYGNGRYGKVLDTTDLGDAKKWSFKFDSYHQYYYNVTDTFHVELYHDTLLDASGVSTTPANFDFTTTLTFVDEYTGAPITGATITFANGAAIDDVVDQGDGTYDISIYTSTLSLGDYSYTFNATHPTDLLHVAQTDVTFTLRAHYTAVSVSGDMETPQGADTSVSIYLLDLDTGLAVDISDVGTMTFSFSPVYPVDSPGSYSATITSDDWAVGTVMVTLTITMSNAEISAPSQYVFDIEILAHETSLTVTGDTTNPYSSQTSLTIILTDLEDSSIVPIGSVSNIRLQHPFGFDDFSGNYAITLDTSAWS